MVTTLFTALLDWPNPPNEAQTVAWPRYSKSAETRDHLAGRKLSPAVLKLELEALRVVWTKVQSNRQRDAVYDFLEAAFSLVSKFSRAGKGGKLLKRLHRQDPALGRIQDPYAAVIHLGSAYSVDSRTRSKWSRLLRYVEQTKKRPGPLDDFIRRNGGINECSSRFRQRK